MAQPPIVGAGAITLGFITIIDSSFNQDGQYCYYLAQVKNGKAIYWLGTAVVNIDTHTVYIDYTFLPMMRK